MNPQYRDLLDTALSVEHPIYIDCTTEKSAVNLQRCLNRAKKTEETENAKDGLPSSYSSLIIGVEGVEVVIKKKKKMFVKTAEGRYRHEA